MHKYQILAEIGHGAYSIVFKARDLMRNNIVAIKRINHTNPDISVVLQRQIKALQSLQHPNIIRLLEVCSDNQYAYLVFQYLPYDLITYYKEVKKIKGRNLNDDQIVYISWQMCQALGYMHQCGLMHRDIKPQNVLIDPSNLTIKLIDFGFATQVNQYGPNTQYMITRWYRPLEIVLNLPYDGKADIFAMGALLLELYLGEEIFRSASNLDQLYWIIEICGHPSGWSQAIQKMNQLGINLNSSKQPQIYKLTNSLNHDAASLIISMLHTNPYRRFSIVEILNHPYFSDLRQSQLKKNSIVSRSSNPLPNGYSNLVLKSSTSRHTICEQNSDKIQNSLAYMKLKTNNSSAHNLFQFSKLDKMKKGLSLQKNDQVIERTHSKVLNLNTNYSSPTNKEFEFKNHNGLANKQQTKQFSTQKFSQKAVQSLTPRINHLYISQMAKQKQECRILQRTQSYGLKKFDHTAETNQKSNQNQNSNSKYLKVGKNADNFQKKTVRHKTQENDKEYSKQKQYEKVKEKEREKQLIKKYTEMQGHTRSNSSLSAEKNFIEKQKQKEVKLLNELDQQSRALKFRTKSYQGISIVSLKRENYNGFNNNNLDNNYHSNQNNNVMSSSSSKLTVNNIQKNPQKVYHSTYGANLNLGSTNNLINNNYATNPNPNRSQIPIHNLQGNIKKKEATFTKIRDKLLIDNKPIGKIKISLTQRERNHIMEREHYMHKPYQVRNMV